jgi:prenyltransferase beta subunit
MKSAAESIVRGLADYIRACRKPDGGVRPNPDPEYGGYSDTSFSDIAAPVYALVLEETFGFRVLDRTKTRKFLESRRGKDGLFRTRQGGKPHLLLYETLQALLGLRIIRGSRLPARETARSAEAVMTIFRTGGLLGYPFYALDFYGQFYSIIGRPIPPNVFRSVWLRYVTGYRGGEVGGHVASTFHFVHFARMQDRSVPQDQAILDKTLSLQKRNGSFNRMPDPDWDVHATFDGAFIVRQLAIGQARDRALAGAARYALSCRNPDGGFGHFPGRKSDLDACYFHAGTLAMAGLLKARKLPAPLARVLGWGHLFPLPAR